MTVGGKARCAFPTVVIPTFPPASDFNDMLGYMYMYVKDSSNEMHADFLKAS